MEAIGLEGPQCWLYQWLCVIQHKGCSSQNSSWPSKCSVVNTSTNEGVCLLYLQAEYPTHQQDDGTRGWCLPPSFKDKTVRAKAIAIHWFTCSIGLTQCTATHTAQKHFTVTEDDAKDFIAMMSIKLQGRDPNDLLNMDQTPIPYSFHSNKMLKEIWSKSVQQRSSTSETKHITLAALSQLVVKCLHCS